VHASSIAITIGYAFAYTCRLALSVVKKPLIDEGIFSPQDLGLIGSALFYSYAFGKLVNGFLADHANMKLFFATGVIASALLNIGMGFSTVLTFSVALWALNGWFQGFGAPAGIVTLASWFSNRERGRFYGIWSTAHSMGEGLTYYVVALFVVWFGWRAGFWVPGLFCIFAGVGIYVLMQDRPPTLGLPRVADWKRDHLAQLAPPETRVLTLQFSIFRIPAIWILAFASATMYVTRYAISSWGILYLRRRAAMGLPRPASSWRRTPLRASAVACCSDIFRTSSSRRAVRRSTCFRRGRARRARVDLLRPAEQRNARRRLRALRHRPEWPRDLAWRPVCGRHRTQESRRRDDGLHRCLQLPRSSRAGEHQWVAYRVRHARGGWRTHVRFRSCDHVLDRFIRGVDAARRDALASEAARMKHYDFVTVGNYTKDTIVSAAGTRYVDGGGYSYAARAARLLGIRVAAITRRAAEDAGVTAPLSDVGIDVYAYDSPSSTLMRLEYPTANVDNRILSCAASPTRSARSISRELRRTFFSSPPRSAAK
jgi:MFS family permease